MYLENLDGNNNKKLRDHPGHVTSTVVALYYKKKIMSEKGQFVT